MLTLRPRLLILDEPTTGFDYREICAMMALIAELNRGGIAIVMITHTPWLVAEYARRVVLMRQGRKFSTAAVREFFAEAELLRTSSFRAPEMTELSRRFGTLALTTGGIRRVGEGARLMPIYLYLDRGTFIHRLHPTVKVFSLFAMFWSVYWVDNPIALFPIGLLMLCIAQITGCVAELLSPAMAVRDPGLHHDDYVDGFLSARRGAGEHPGLSREPASLVFGLGRGIKLAELLAASVLFLSTTKIEEFTSDCSACGFRIASASQYHSRSGWCRSSLIRPLTIVDAQRLRGYDFNQGGPLERVRRYVPVVIPVFMGALRKANNMAMALEARGFGFSHEPTTFIEYPVTPADVIAFAFLIALGTLYFMLYWTGLGGIGPLK